MRRCDWWFSGRLKISGEPFLYDVDRDRSFPFLLLASNCRMRREGLWGCEALPVMQRNRGMFARHRFGSSKTL
jgi:hypothetical protein